MSNVDMRQEFAQAPAPRMSGSAKWDLLLAQQPNPGPEVIPFSIADMELPTPPAVRQALISLIETTPLGYATPTPAFRDACRAWQQRRHGWDAQAEWMVISPGVVPALFDAVAALTKPGDGVIVQTPVYNPFFDTVRRNNRVVVENPLELRDGSYCINFEHLESCLAHAHVSMMLLCSPHNPVGRVWTREELTRIAKLCARYEVTLVSDEIHEDLVMCGHTHVTIAHAAHEAGLTTWITCTAPSKTFNIPGCQTSVIFIPNTDQRAAFEARQVEACRAHVNSFGCTAATAAWNECEPWLEAVVELIATNAKLLKTWISTAHPELVMAELEGTYLAWIDCSAWGMADDDLNAFLMGKAQLFACDGVRFGHGGAGHIRINLACPTHLLEVALKRLDRALSSRAHEVG